MTFRLHWSEWLLVTVFALLALWLLNGCTASGNFDGQAFGAAVNALDGTYRTYEDEKRLNQYPQYAPYP